MRSVSVFVLGSLGRFALALTLPAALIASPDALAARSPYEWAHIRLDYARREKAEQLGRFCERMRKMARKAAEDRRVAAFFNLNLAAHRANDATALPAGLDKKIDELRKDFDRHYVENYFAFHDMLFVDDRGNVIYTIRKESDLHANLLDGARRNHPLGRALSRSGNSESFVDFHFYAPSREPAAFFVEPITAPGGNKGWVVLQCAINRVHSLFASTRDLGQTGETLLVNENGFMLTESLFTGEPTCLKKKLDDRNIRTKFQKGAGSCSRKSMSSRTAPQEPLWSPTTMRRTTCVCPGAWTVRAPTRQEATICRIRRTSTQSCARSCNPKNPTRKTEANHDCRSAA